MLLVDTVEVYSGISDLCVKEKRKKRIHFSDSDVSKETGLDYSHAVSFSRLNEQVGPNGQLGSDLVTQLYSRCSVACGRTLLMLASMENDFNRCCALLASDLDYINCKDGMGYTALMYAVRDGYSTIVRLLLEHGADASIGTKSGYCPVLCAALNGFTDILDLLSNYTPLDVKDEDGFTALMCACQNRHPDCVRLLLKWGVDPYVVNHCGVTAIALCVVNGSLACINVFLQSEIYLRLAIGDQTIGALYACAFHRQWPLIRQVLPYYAYIEELIDDLVFTPNVAVEDTIMHMVRELAQVLSPLGRRALCATFATRASFYLHAMKDAFEGRLFSDLPLSGIVETVLWCIRIVKMVSGGQVIPQMEFFWSFVEAALASCGESSLASCGECEKSSQSSDLCDISVMCVEDVTGGVRGEEAGRWSLARVKLVFSMLELYCFGVGDVADAAECGGRPGVSVSPRLAMLMDAASRIIQSLVFNNPSIYNHMVFFADAFRSNAYTQTA